MSTGYVVRLAGPEYVGQLPDIEREAATRFGDSLPASVLSHVTPLDRLAAAQQAGLLWVALGPAGDPVGFAVASICGRRVHLDELDVLPGHGRKGLGSALVEAVEDRALDSGCVEITLTTFRDVPWNAPFYARLGFEPIPEQELDAELVRRLSDEAALGLERSGRVAMRKPLSRPASTSSRRRCTVPHTCPTSAPDLSRSPTPTGGSLEVDIPRIFTITESAHRIHDPITAEKLATLGAALRLDPGSRVLDLGSGSGEMLCTWARDHGVTGTGIDMSPLFTTQARLRAEELGVAGRVEFIHGDAAGYVSDERVDVAACVGATWIGGGVAGTIELLSRSLRSGGIILVGEPYWRQLPPTEDIARGCLATAVSDFHMLPGLLASFGHLGYDVVEMVLADQDGWDRYEAAKWLTMRRWLEANPGDELAPEVRAKLTSEPERYATFTREYLGWGVFALMPR